MLAVEVLAITVGGRRIFRGSTLPEHRTVALSVAGLGGLAFVLMALGDAISELALGDSFLVLAGQRRGFELGVMYLAIGGVAYWRGSETRLRDVLAAGLVALLGLVLALTIILPGEYVTHPEAVRRGVKEAIRLLPLLAMLVLGATVASGNRREILGGLLAVLGAFFVAELSVVWPSQRPFDLGVIVLFLGSAAGVALLGIPLFLLGGTCTEWSPTTTSAR